MQVLSREYNGSYIWQNDTNITFTDSSDHVLGWNISIVKCNGFATVSLAFLRPTNVMNKRESIGTWTNENSLLDVTINKVSNSLSR